jgi:hypothetical protein
MHSLGHQLGQIRQKALLDPRVNEIKSSPVETDDE